MLQPKGFFPFQTYTYKFMNTNYSLHLFAHFSFFHLLPPSLDPDWCIQRISPFNFESHYILIAFESQRFFDVSLLLGVKFSEEEAHKTFQSHFNFFVQGAFEWVNVKTSVKFITEQNIIMLNNVEFQVQVTQRAEKSSTSISRSCNNEKFKYVTLCYVKCGQWRKLMLNHFLKFAWTNFAPNLSLSHVHHALQTGNSFQEVLRIRSLPSTCSSGTHSILCFWKWKICWKFW